MKKLLKFALRILSAALVILLVCTFLPVVKPWLQGLLPKGKYIHTSTQLTHAMEKAGNLTAVTYTDTGVAVSETKALLLGTVQKVSIPYEYEIGFGFALSDVTLTADENSITVQLPPIRMLYDRFTVTGDADVDDFWYHLSENRYQSILDEQTLSCRSGYLESKTYQQAAFDAACESLSGLFRQWSGEESLPLTFVPAPDDASSILTAQH